ncbi:MAG TPA: FixH family protein [Alphaproteobacteria bacterium]|nr:FixH family protein [Alphaproteobacteria bacterium]
MTQTLPDDDKKPEEEKPAAEEKGAEEGAAPADAAAPEKSAKKPMPTWMGLAFLGLFLFLALAVGYILWLVFTSYNLASDESYFKSFRDGRVVQKKTYKDPLGLDSELMVDKKRDKPARIRFLLRNKYRQPITDAKVDVRMVRPFDPKAKAYQAALAMSEPGVYRGEVDMPEGGEWEAHILVHQGQSAYQVTERVIIPETEDADTPPKPAAK